VLPGIIYTASFSTAHTNVVLLMSYLGNVSSQLDNKIQFSSRVSALMSQND